MYTLVYKIIDFLLTEGISVGYVPELPEIVQSWEEGVFKEITTHYICGVKYDSIETLAGLYYTDDNEIWLNMNEVESGFDICELVAHELCHWLISLSDAEVSDIVEEDICLRAERLVSRKEAISLE